MNKLLTLLSPVLALAQALYGAQASAQLDCAELASSSNNTVMTINSAEKRSATESLPAFCQVIGTIDPNIGFEARLPISNWNDKFYQAGCGGFCGVVGANRESQSNSINHALRRGYATIITDGGHQSPHSGDASWGLNNPQAEEVYAHKVLPLTHAAGHELTVKLYGEKPRYSYFSGCSNGGRLAAIAAQRYPALFDGIISGCPVLNLSENGGVFGSWVLQANHDHEGRKILDHHFKSKLPMLEANAVAECDALDGQPDGVISQPSNCRITLSKVPSCEADNVSDHCLTDAERQVVLKWYQGAVSSKGKSLFYGMPPGSERYWGFWYLGTETNPGPGSLLAQDYGRYLGFTEDPENFSAHDFNFDTDPEKLATQGHLFNALDPDLASFAAAGGKLLMWHGMSDPLVLPDQSKTYYQSVVEKMGAKKTADFFRLFMAPGLGHCWELPAAQPDQMDILSMLEAWVEQGKAPEKIALNANENSQQSHKRGTLYPYPMNARYFND